MKHKHERQSTDKRRISGITEFLSIMTTIFSKLKKKRFKNKKVKQQHILRPLELLFKQGTKKSISHKNVYKKMACY